MKSDELRALADALEPMAKAPRFEDFDVPAFCAWVRAQADAQPVAWRTFDGEGNYDYRAYELNEDYADEWNRRNPNHVGWVEPLYAHPAPAAQQAEPIDPHMIVADDRFPDEQAEPKREPTCLWSRADDDTDVWETSCGHAFTIIDGTPGDNHMEFCCYCGRPLEQEIGGSDAE